MIKRKARHIDWRRQFSQLDKYMDGAGGVVNVRHRGVNCGVMAFLGTLTATFESRGETHTPKKCDGVSIRLDPDNYKVRYLMGIRSEFERKLGKQSFKIERRMKIDLEGQILTQNTAGGDQHIEAVLNIDPDPLMSAERHDWVSAVVEALRDHLKTKRFMIVLACGSSVEQREFWSSLWGRASELIHDGLLLVRIIDEDAHDGTVLLDACPGDCDVTLNAALADSAVKDAIEDIAQLIRETVPGQSEASCIDLAKGYVLSRKDSVSALHNGLLSFTSGLMEFE
jgi:hypothetical protein